MGVFEKPMDLAVAVWRMTHDEIYRDHVKEVVEIGKKWHNQQARELLEACESLDPTETYGMVEKMNPSSYVIAQLVIMAKAAQKTQSARSLANKKHKENHAMKADVFVWLDTNMCNFKSMDKAAEAVIRQQPIAFRTARDWVGDWKKLRYASTP